MRVTILACALVFGGCTINVTPVATGGSKADGTVVMSYEVGDMQTAKVDWTSAAQSAAQRCGAWGYSSAEAFGGETRTCQISGGFGGCSRWIVSMSYQCTE